MKVLWAIVSLILLALWGLVLLAPQSGLPVAVAVVPTVVAGLVAVGLTVFRRLRTLKAAKDLERTLASQGEDQERGARPDLQPEIQQMRAEFAKAIQALKGSKLARGGADALSVLPWYMIVGPPGAGKSTALRNSGLKFPYLSKRGGVRGVGGTRNCDWWLTNEAVILDTAGRYTSEEDDRDEWLAFLDTLRKTRPRKPVNGLIVAVSASDLLALDEQGAADLGQKLRERVDELTGRLKVVVPVYVLVTKCDLVAGFVEMFGDLPRSERGQVWGFTFPSTGPGEDPREPVLERFDELVAVLEERMIRRVGQERRMEVRERLYQFPRQFAALRDLLGELVQPLFSGNPYQDTPLMRGLYFTSGTQEGKPIDRLMNAMGEAFGIRRTLSQAATAAPATEARSYFLRDLFGEIIFRDQKLAVRSSAEAQRQGRLRYAYAGAGLLLAFLVLLLPTISFFKNRELAVSLQNEVKRFADVEATGRASGLDLLSELEPMRKLLARLEEHAEGGPPLSMRFGMYQGDRLLMPAFAVYGSAVRRLLVDPVLERHVDDMLRLATDGGGSPSQQQEEFGQTFAKLKLHLLLSHPRASTEPVPNQGQRQWIADQLTSSQKKELGEDLKPVAEAHALLYAKLLPRDPERAFPRNLKAIETTRRALERVDLTELRLEQQVEAWGRDESDLTPKFVFDSATSPFVTDRRVRAAFTRKVWEKKVREALSKPLEDPDAWVLNLPALDEKGLSKLREHYYYRYSQEWREFIESLKLRPVKNGDDLLQRLGELADRKPLPLARLFTVVADNVRLMQPEGSKGSSGVVEKLGQAFKKGEKLLQTSSEEREAAKELAEDFASFLEVGIPSEKEEEESPYLTQYHETLLALKKDLEKAAGPADRLTIGRLARTKSAEVANLLKERKDAERLLAGLLLPPLDVTAELLFGGNNRLMDQGWCSKVWTPFKQRLLNLYPFKKGSRDAALADFSDAYKPGGLIWRFYDEKLQEYVVQDGERYRFIPEANGSQIFYGSLPTFLSRSNEITSALFERGSSSEVKVEFEVKIGQSRDIYVASFTVDGKQVKQYPGPDTPGDLVWPGTGGTRGATLRASSRSKGDDELSYSGEWGLFKLLEDPAVKLKSVNGRREFTVEWTSKKLGVLPITFTAKSAQSPFLRSSGGGNQALFQMFRGGEAIPPRSIAQQGGGCN